ncbi:MAG TPA: hypothetical protein V6C89_02875 [Drouetiella sp.]|jgi:hypothetical protein
MASRVFAAQLTTAEIKSALRGAVKVFIATTCTTALMIATQQAFAESHKSVSPPLHMLKATPPVNTSGQTAVQAFEGSRELWAQMFLHMKATPDNPRGAKLIEALRPIALKYFRMPLTLVSEKDDGNTARLVFKATDPATDFVIGSTATKSSDGWSFSDLDLKGRNSVDIAVEPFNAVASIFPNEIATINLGLTIFLIGLVAYLVATMFLIIAAFRTSVLWGLVALMVPCGNIIFAVCRWKEARTSFLASIISLAAVAVGLAIPVSVLQSLNGVQRMLPDFVPSMTDDQTTQLIKNGLKNSPNLKLQRIN